MLGLFKSAKNANVTDVPADKTADKSRTGWFARLKSGLAKTGSKLTGLFGGRRIDESLFEDIETALISADTGVDASGRLLAELRSRARSNKLEDGEQLKRALAELLSERLAPLETQLDVRSAKPFVIMVTGVNGAGKTTSIGKLAHYFQSQGLSVLLAAGDTFRAAAREQLVAWGERNNVAVISHSGGANSSDPAAVIFDAVQAARARGIDVVLADTAGRLPTQLHLMEELKKVKRVIAKADPGAPHAVWLILDANTGQNGLTQFRAFDDALGLTGLILTKLDGTAKGGVIAAIADSQSAAASAKKTSETTRTVPVAFIGVGEGIEDLRPFKAREFVDALLD